MVDERKKRIISRLLKMNNDYKKKGKPMLTEQQVKIFKKSINPKTEHTVVLFPQLLDTIEEIISLYKGV